MDLETFRLNYPRLLGGQRTKCYLESKDTMDLKTNVIKYFLKSIVSLDFRYFSFFQTFLNNATYNGTMLSHCILVICIYLIFNYLFLDTKFKKLSRMFGRKFENVCTLNSFDKDKIKLMSSEIYRGGRYTPRNHQIIPINYNGEFYLEGCNLKIHNISKGAHMVNFILKDEHRQLIEVFEQHSR